LIVKRVPDDIICTEDDKQKVQEHATDDKCAQIESRSARSCTRQQGIQVQTCNRAVDVEPKKKSGRGLPRAMTLNDNAIDYVHWNDLNELVDRLRLFEASR